MHRAEVRTARCMGVGLFGGLTAPLTLGVFLPLIFVALMSCAGARIFGPVSVLSEEGSGLRRAPLLLRLQTPTGYVREYGWHGSTERKKERQSLHGLALMLIAAFSLLFNHPVSCSSAWWITIACSRPSLSLGWMVPEAISLSSYPVFIAG